MAKAICAFLLPLSFVFSTHAKAQTATADCRAAATSSAILLRVSAFKKRSGMINVWVYGSNPRDFLARN